jgi:DNA-binding GntR family transcriptional regulator
MLKTIDAVPTRDELVYARLRRAIVEGTLEPGQDVVVTTVQLGVRRIPDMHGCQRLIGDGFLVSSPRRSITVAPITRQRIAEGNEVLLALECVALEHAGQRRVRRMRRHGRPGRLGRAQPCRARLPPFPGLV